MRYFVSSLFVCLTLLTAPTFAQSDADLQKIETAKIGFITNRLNLTPEQAQPFWAVYNEYNGRKREINRRIRQLSRDANKPGLAEQNVVADLREINSQKQKLTDLDTEFTNRFLKVITPKQLAELYRAERDFNRTLLERLNNPRN